MSLFRPDTRNVVRIKGRLREIATERGVANSQMRGAVADLARLDREQDALLAELHAEVEGQR